MSNCIVIIPIYKEQPNHSEKSSFQQVLRILSKHNISIITYNGIDLSIYYEIALNFKKKINISYFDKSFFTSISGYNELCLSKQFYQRFLQFKYMLIYQLDAWVFKDDLDFWCSKNYDYIGAPWFKNWGKYEKGNELWEVGNGGFSLRKTYFFYSLLSYPWPLSYKITTNKGIIEFIKSILKIFGIHNTISWHISKEKKHIPEDYFFTQYIKYITTIKRLYAHMPSVEEAALFSFERSPSYLFSLCNYHLPFGCHAYKKNEFDSFWFKYIKED